MIYVIRNVKKWGGRTDVTRMEGTIYDPKILVIFTSIFTQGSLIVYKYLLLCLVRKYINAIKLLILMLVVKRISS